MRSSLGYFVSGPVGTSRSRRGCRQQEGFRQAYMDILTAFPGRGRAPQETKTPHRNAGTPGSSEAIDANARLSGDWEMAQAIVYSLLIALVLGAPAARGESSRIELQDGSVISGEVVGFSEGHYLIQSPTLGQISVDQSQIRSVQPGNADPSSSGYASEIQSLQQQMIGDPEIINMLTALQNDPEVQAALADPEFMRLVTSGNLGALQSNPRFQRLINNPSLRAIRDHMSVH